MTVRPPLQLGMIGYGAIGKHVEAALKAGNIENLKLVAALVKRPRNEGLLTHEPDRFFAHKCGPMVREFWKVARISW